MRAAYGSSSYANRPSAGSRAVSFLLALALAGLVVWMLLRLGLLPDVTQPTSQRAFSLIDVAGDRSSQSAQKVVRVSKAHRIVAAPVPKPAAAIPPPKVPPPPIPWIQMSHDDFVSSDIAAKPSRAQEQAAAGGSAETADSGSGGGSDQSTGGGPNGERLYNAQWYPRPPTQAEMDFYMPKTGTAGEGWGEIACRTAPRYSVVDCRPLGESPGSGFARALLDAAWQFHVLPPRVNGRAMVGTWVRIHFDFIPKAAPGGP